MIASINIKIEDLVTNTKEYREGWNACQGGNCTIFANPYFFEQSELWLAGWKDNQKAWNDSVYINPSFI